MLHKTYNSINLLIASLFIIQLYFKRNNSIITKLILLLLLAVFLISIIYFKSLTVIFLVVTILPINILFLKYNKKLAAFLSGVIVLIIISAVIVKKDVVINNFKKETIQNQDGLEESDLNGISERFFLNKTSTKVISKSPIFGYGIGDVQDQLNDQNFANSKTTKQYLKFYLNKLNSHNYYYNLILIGGPLLLISFIFMMYYNMGMAIKNKEYSYLSFLIIIVICLFFENLFDRMTGVLSFTLINSLLAKNIFDRK
ncbi:O-antigen ligase family protein [Lacinutrix sp.]|uniref:O-antigen ligase family protein n=1 Tax=Lacinutrix sp. TaxID=1937692 RepID=UPI00345131D5